MNALVPYLVVFAVGMYFGMAFLAFWVARRERVLDERQAIPRARTPITWSAPRAAPRAAPRVARVTAAAIAELRDADRRVPS